MSRKCYGSTSVSKTEGRGPTPWRDAKIWAGSDNGSTGALQAFSRGSIPRRSTKYGAIDAMACASADCKSVPSW